MKVERSLNVIGISRQLRSVDPVLTGWMAVRELEASDPELADALMLADYNVKHCA